MDLLETKADGKVLVIELLRPAEGNALNRKLQRELAQVWQELDDSEEVSVGVIHGGDKVFSIGHDVAELLNENASPVPELDVFPLNIRKPVIAAIEGPCYGLGLELALSCDLRVAGQGSLLGFPDHNLFVPYRVASVLLPRMTFAGLSLELLFTGEVLGADEAELRRLVNIVAPLGEALSQAIQAGKMMAERFAAPGDFKKRSLWQLSGMPLTSAMEIVRSPIQV